jgi:hypothetical protein
MWSPTFFQRVIHFFGERTEVLAFNNLYSSIMSICLSSESAPPVVEEDFTDGQPACHREETHSPYHRRPHGQCIGNQIDAAMILRGGTS